MIIKAEPQGHTEASACPVPVLEHKYTSLSASRPHRLDNMRLTLSTTGQSAKPQVNEVDTRKQFWGMLEALRDFTTLPRIKACNRVPVGPLVSLHEGGENIRAGYGALATCGSAHSCPVCTRKVAAHRAQELTQIVAYAQRKGWVVSLLTLTQKHSQKDGLGTLFDSLQSGWHTLTSSRRWREWKTSVGLKGWCKSVETTIGFNSAGQGNGYHVHLHCLLLTERKIDTKVLLERRNGVEVTTGWDIVSEYWAKGLAKKGIGFDPAVGMDWEEARDANATAQYVAKMGIAKEMTLGHFKKGRFGNRTPFQVLADFIEHGEELDLKIWHIWEKYSKGRRSVSFSKEIREIKREIGLVEKTDQEVASEDPGGEVVLLLDHDSWRAVRAYGAYNLIEACETGGAKGAREWCDMRGIRWRPPEVGKYRERQRE